MSRFTALAVVATVSLTALAVPAQAAVIIYTSEPAFTTALGGTTTLEDFNDNALASPLSSITTTKGKIQGNHWSDSIGANSTTTFNFASAINGFGGYFQTSVGGPGPGIAVQLLNGSTLVGTVGSEIPNGNGQNFWGFVSDTAFDSVRFVKGTQNGKKLVEGYNLDNARYGMFAAVAVPEPATWTMMILGIGMIGGVMRRQRASVRYRLT